jgi:effector-binding domain-containing protein
MDRRRKLDSHLRLISTTPAIAPVQLEPISRLPVSRATAKTREIDYQGGRCHRFPLFARVFRSPLQVRGRSPQIDPRATLISQIHHQTHCSPLHQLASSAAMASEATSTPSIKPLPAVRVLSLRKVVENYRAQKDLWPVAIGAARSVGVSIAGACFTTYYDLGFKARDVDMEVCLPIPDDAPVDEDKLPNGVHLRSLAPEPRAAVITHYGSYTHLPATYEKLEAWISTEKLRCDGPVREVYVSMDHSDASEASFVTEIQRIVE